MLKIYCAYCKKFLREKEFKREDVRYGVCPECVKKSRERENLEDLLEKDEVVTKLLSAEALENAM